MIAEGEDFLFQNWEQESTVAVNQPARSKAKDGSTLAPAASIANSQLGKDGSHSVPV